MPMAQDPPIVLVVGGESERAYFDAVLSQAHPFADLAGAGVEVHCARGDSEIPALTEDHLNDGREVVVLYDRDALERAHEQASVLRTEGIRVHELEADFEAAFDAEIIQRALEALDYEAELECLHQARESSRAFAAIEECAQPVGDAKPLSKVLLATACAEESVRTWYVPVEIYNLAIRLGELRGLGRFGGTMGWDESAISALEGSGRLYVSNHVSNGEVPYWDFDRGLANSIALPESFDGRVAICRNGRRFVLRKHERSGGGEVGATQIFVMDLDKDSLACTQRFGMQGFVYELSADEDGNHLELLIQDPHDRKRAVRCLADGTQRETIAQPQSDGLYAARASRNGQLVGSGPRPLTIMDQGKPIATLPHFYACSYAWSPDERHLAFFGRRWGRRVNSQDFHWVLDLKEDRVHRVAAGNRHMPTYWARREK